MRKLMIVLACLAPMFAQAAEKKSFTLSVNEMLDLTDALGKLDGATVAVEDGAKKSAVPQAFKFSVNVRLAIAENIEALRDALRAPQATIMKLRATETDATRAAVMEQLIALGSETKEVTLYTLTPEELALEENKEIRVSTLASLRVLMKK